VTVSITVAPDKRWTVTSLKIFVTRIRRAGKDSAADSKGADWSTATVLAGKPRKQRMTSTLSQRLARLEEQMISVGEFRVIERKMERSDGIGSAPGVKAGFRGSLLLRTGSLPSAAPGTREVRSAATARTLNQRCLNSRVLRGARL
jgi:hypothetical protein